MRVRCNRCTSVFDEEWIVVRGGCIEECPVCRKSDALMNQEDGEDKDEALSLAEEQMAQCERMFRDDGDFMGALRLVRKSIEWLPRKKGRLCDTCVYISATKPHCNLRATEVDYDGSCHHWMKREKGKGVMCDICGKVSDPETPWDVCTSCCRDLCEDCAKGFDAEGKCRMCNKFCIDCRWYKSVEGMTGENGEDVGRCTRAPRLYTSGAGTCEHFSEIDSV